MKKMWILMVLVLAGWLGRTSAQTPAVIWSDKAGWHKVGEKVVDLDMEEDEILVLGADKFSALKFKVTDASIEILSAEVIFEDEDEMLGREERMMKDRDREKDAIDRDAMDKNKEGVYKDRTEKEGIYKDKAAKDQDKWGMNKDYDQEEALNRQVIPVNTPLTAGTETRVFELTGGTHEIKKIKFRYKTLPNASDERATIEVWGFKTAVKETEAKPEL